MSGWGDRPIAGRLRFPSPPQPGTILGPKVITRELVVVLGQDEEGFTVLGYAQYAELDAARDRVLEGDIRSVTEWRSRASLHASVAAPGSAVGNLHRWLNP